MKKQLPLILSTVIGLLAIAVFYIPAQIADDVENTLLAWGQVLATAALILGGINIVQVNYPKIRRREKDWQYKVLLLVSAALMLLAGIPWHKLGGGDAATVVKSIADEREPALAHRGRAAIRIEASGYTMVSIDGTEPRTVGKQGVIAIEVEPGSHELRLFAGAPDFRIAGYREFRDSVTVDAGMTAIVAAPVVMEWGLTGRVFTWLYDHVFDPCNSTMFALLAFFIASAAFRAFRARNVEAALLLGAAILVMLGRVPIGSLLSDSFPAIADWMVDVPNNAGRRAIMMGAALGAVSTGLRVILGIERSHLGAD